MGTDANTMKRRLRGSLVLATHNDGKLREMDDLLAPFGITTLSAKVLGLPEPEETGLTFGDNARLKANRAAKAANMPALADDSGLCVAALDGAPGIYSARWAGLEKNFAAAMEKIEEALQAKCAFAPSDRRAWFVCALALAWPDGEEATFEGRVDGTLVWPPRGTLGFGYDPMFLPDGHSRTFGQMSAEEKHGLPTDNSLALSHRARAFQFLASACLY